MFVSVIHYSHTQPHHRLLCTQ